MPKIPNQKPVWDRKHSAGEHESLRHAPSPLAELSEPMFREHSFILELGCGVGRDAEFFAKKSHEIIATDASEIVIEQDKQHFPALSNSFEVLDMLEAMPYPKEAFDVVYANLSLHYYSDGNTRKIVEAIARVLKPKGLLVFACKSVDDFHHGNGEEVEKNVFVSEKGHVRHLFSEDYARSILENTYQIEMLDIVYEEYNSKKSNILRCIARKIR